MESTDEIHCPTCGSTQLTAQKKGFSGKKAVAGVVLTGGIGLLAGTIGSSKIDITCLNCGNKFMPGQGNKPSANPKMIWDEAQNKHVVNPAYKSDVVSAPLWVVVSAIVAIIAIAIYIISR